MATTEEDARSFVSGISGDLASVSTDDNDFYLDGDEERDETKEVTKLASNETRNVRVWRMVVLAFLAISGAVVSMFTFKYLESGQTEDYVEAYGSFSKTIEDVTKSRVEGLFRSHRDFAENIAAYAISSNSPWPFVTPPMFEITAEQVRVQSRVEGIAFAPIVEWRKRSEWESYSVKEQGWIQDSRKNNLGKNGVLPVQDPPFDLPISERIMGLCPNASLSICPLEESEKEVVPAWMISPPPFLSTLINIDIQNTALGEYNIDVLKSIRDTRDISLHVDLDTDFLNGQLTSQDSHLSYHEQFVETDGKDPYTRPHAVMFTPIFEMPGDLDSDIVAATISIVAFDAYVSELLPDDVTGIVLVIKNSCDNAYTYELSGRKAKFLGPSDLHDPNYDHMAVNIPFHRYWNETRSTDPSLSHCVYEFTVYPNEIFVSKYEKNLPILFTTLIAGIFVSTIVVFFVYDWMGHRRNEKVVDAAARSNAIVSSLFPTNVRDQLMENTTLSVQPAPQIQLKSYLNKEVKEAREARDHDGNSDIILPGKPLAELFPEATIMFADIAGFTAWSSVRDPSQVFTLLETLYRAFDTVARKRRIFKVETIGDCYVAVSGVPDPRKDHAVAMVRFAQDCLYQMRILTKRLEVTLGPDTGDLQLRVGLHSGPVTAGVLRGDKSRFQLFGDTMNTASRIESTGAKDRIQVSDATAKLLKKYGKGNWLELRHDLVEAKGKGKLQTYFIRMRSPESNGTSNVPGPDMSENEFREDEEGVIRQLMSERTSRLIDWTVDILSRLIRQIVARREACGFSVQRLSTPSTQTPSGPQGSLCRSIPLFEVKEIVALPEFDPVLAETQEDADNVKLSDELLAQVHDFVTNIAALYNDNPFHNFEHASHVTMSVVKLLGRIISPTDLAITKGTDFTEYSSKLHDHTYGITSDPLTQFACVLSALVHDVDHTGVPNTQLMKENKGLADYYQGKSLAEQNSIDVAWELLMSKQYAAIHSAVFPTEPEKSLFRQILVNSVMATDIMDKDLKALRNARWEKAFSEATDDADNKDTRNRKATIVIEHLIQASDVAHTMQHWHVYQKWNERLFRELYQAYRDGRSTSNPVDFWYKGEMAFFDFYIIPLAKKLKDCGVFGVSSDEYLNYALRNREEWELRGEEVVAVLKETVGN